MMEEMPDRAFDVGIAEQHAVTFSAGLAAEGLIPFCNIYSTFLQRGYDQLIHDVAIQKLPVIFCIDRAGLVGEDGATHQGVFDLAYLRCIPNMIISAPLNEVELHSSDIDVEVYENQQVNLTQSVRDSILLAVPAICLCEGGCKGLCSQCGKNLNHAFCQCKCFDGIDRLPIG